MITVLGSRRNGWSSGSGSSSKTSSPAPAIVPSWSARISAASSTMGPREVLTRYALRFMRPSSRAPMSPRVRSPRTRWIETKSERASSSSLGVSVAPTSAARSAVRFWLHASTSISKARPTFATREPSVPSPSTPSVLPFRPSPTVVCQRPSRVARSSAGMRRASARISPHASSAVGYGSPAVPQTSDAALGRRLHVDGGIAHARGDEELELGQALEQRPRERRPLAQGHDDVEVGQPRRERGLVGQVVLEGHDLRARGQALPVGHAERHALVVVEKRHARH